MFLVPVGILALREDTQTVEAYGLAVPVKCVAIGFPRPTVKWSRNDKVLGPPVSIMYNFSRTRVERDLALGQVKLSDGGSYFCNATNTINSTTHSVEMKFSLVVNSEFSLI